MVNIDEYHIEVLEEELQRRQRINQLYSIRAYARYLGISQSVLTQILKRKRRLPEKYAQDISKRLDLNQEEANQFLKSIQNKKITLDSKDISQDVQSSKELSDKDHYKIISQWEHLAVLCLTETVDFVSDIDWMAIRLGLSSQRIQKVVERLISADLLTIDEDGRYRQQYMQLKTTQDIPSQALKEAQLENCDLGKAKYLDTPLEKKYYGSTTFAINSKKIDKAKELIRNFRRSLSEFLEVGEQDEVYQLVVQLYPLTQNNSGEKQ